MRKIKITWKNTNYGKAAYAGSVRIGSYHWNAVTKSPQWRAVFFYDSYSRTAPFLEKWGADTEEECRELIEKAFDKFMEALHK